MIFYLCIMNSILEICTRFYLTLIIRIMFGRGFIRLYLLRLYTHGLSKRYLKLSTTCSIHRKIPLEINNRPSELKSYPDQLIDQYAFVPISSIKQKLLQRDKIFLDGHTCISTTCPSCKSPALSLYINKITGSFVCISCKKSGSWDLLEMYLNSKRPTDLPQDESMNYGKNAWAELSSQLTPLDDDFIGSSFLSTLKVPLHLYDEFEAKVDPSTNEICFPLMSDKDSVGYKILKSDFSEETFPYKGAKGIVVCKRQKKSALIVAKLLDFLSLLNLPLDHDIICLPHGQESLPQEVLPLFEQYSELVLWFDNDNVSWGNAKMFAKKLSESRCSLVRPLENQPAPYACLQSGYDILNVIKNAQPVSHTSIVTFANLREDVLTELYNADKVSGVKWERFPTLNTILKGHRRGELTILTGPTGSGKTTFMSEYSLDLACNKVTTLWGSFEIRNQRLAKTMMTQMFSAPLEKNLDKFNEWADKFERLPIYFMTFHGQQPLNIVMEAVEHATYVHDVAHVIIDNVQFMLGLSSNESGFMDRFYRQDALIASFRNFATTFNCHVTLVIHPRKERDAEQLSALSIFGGAKAAQEADNILIIQHRTSHTSLRIKKFLQVAKNRFSGDLGIMPLDFDKESLSFRTRQK